MPNRRFALEYLASRPWALEAGFLEDMRAIAERDPELQALEARAGETAGSNMEMREGGVALLHVNGAVSRYASMFHAICGGTSTQMLARDLNAALDDPAVKSIILNFDSPGGDANGLHELAEMIYNARDRKKVVAYVGGTAASAAYWMASAASEVVIDATARLGSIGTVMSLRRLKNGDGDRWETFEFVSRQSPKKRLDPATEEGAAENQNHVDTLSDIFIDRVARNMAVSREHVLAEFGQGGIVIGQQAIDRGMAHRLGSLEGLITEMQQSGPRAGFSFSKRGATQNMSKPITLAENASTADIVAALKADHPELVTALVAQETRQDMAAEHAAALVAACDEKGVAFLSASLLAEGVTHAQALQRIDDAAAVKAACTAAGIEASAEPLVRAMGKPGELVGKAIHEARAQDEKELQSAAPDTTGTPKAKLSARDVYQKRNAGAK